MRQLPFTVEAAAKLLRESSTLATPLLTIALCAYGDELFGDANHDPMDPVELFTRLEEDFRAELPEAAENRLNAILLAVSTDAFYQDPVAFNSIAASLATGDIGDMPDGLMEDLSLPEAFWAVYEVGICRDDEMHLSPEIVQEIEGLTRKEASSGETSHYEEFVQHQKLELASQLAQIGARLPLSELHHEKKATTP